MGRLPRWSDARSEILSRIDLETILGPHLDHARRRGLELQACCPFHDESTPSWAIHVGPGDKRGLHKCMACGASGDFVGLWQHIRGVSFADAVNELADHVGVGADDAGGPPGHDPLGAGRTEASAPNRPARTSATISTLPPPAIPAKRIRAWHDALMARPQLLDALCEARGLSRSTVQRALIGHDGERFTLPIRDPDGKVVNVRRYALPPNAGRAKMLNYVDVDTGYRYGTPPRLYGLDMVVAERDHARPVVVCEGEWDRVIATQAGYLAVTGTHGASVWREEWTHALKGKQVILAFDDDKAGRAARDAVAVQLLGDGECTVYMVVWPQTWGGKDISDWALQHHAEPRHGLPQLLDEPARWEDHGQAEGGPPDPASDPDMAWMTLLRWHTDEKGRERLVHDTGNLVMILTNHPDWKGRLVLDEFSGRQRWTAEPPKPKGVETAMARVTSFPADVRDEHWVAVSGWMAREWGWFPGKSTTLDAMQAAMDLQAIHPLRVYLESVQWDGTPRVDQWLTTYLHAAATPATARVGRWWLISAVARIFQAGCQADHMLILEGLQEAGKSSAVRALAGEWYQGKLGNIESKEGQATLQGAWIIEIGELDAFRGKAATAIKDFVTQVIDVFRPAYGRLQRWMPRQCVFVGTTNESQYLRDPTGARRFWPVQVGGVIDVARLQRDRDQIWAEAVTLFRAGEQWWPARGDNVREELLALQEARQDVDPWEESVGRYLAGQDETSLQAVLDFLDVPLERRTRTEQMRVGAIVHRAKWKRVRRKVDSGQHVWRYVPEHVDRQMAIGLHIDADPWTHEVVGLLGTCREALASTLLEALGADPADRVAQTRLGAVMRAEGWKKVRVRTEDGVRIHKYLSPFTKAVEGEMPVGDND